MVKVYCVFDDKSKVTYTIKKNSVPFEQYANRHVNSPGIVSIIVQKYPKKDNPPIDWFEHLANQEDEEELCE